MNWAGSVPLRRFKWPRRTVLRSVTRIIFALARAVILAFVIAAGIGFWLQAPQTTPTASDLLVVLGGGVGDRVVQGLRLYELGLAPNVLVTGAQDTRTRDRFTTRDARLNQFRLAGASPASLFVDGNARSTWAEAHAIRDLMAREHWTRVLIITDPPHMTRVRWALERAFAGSELRFRLVSSEPSWWSAWFWWTNRSAAVFVGKEMFKNIYYRIKYG